MPSWNLPIPLPNAPVLTALDPPFPREGTTPPSPLLLPGKRGTEGLGQPDVPLLCLVCSQSQQSHGSIRLSRAALGPERNWAGTTLSGLCFPLLTPPRTAPSAHPRMRGPLGALLHSQALHRDD